MTAYLFLLWDEMEEMVRTIPRENKIMNMSNGESKVVKIQNVLELK